MKSTGRILTTHVGSLVRPPELVAFLKRQQNHEPYDSGAYEECLRRSVAEVVKGQADAGIDIVSDGEFGKSISWSRYVLERLSGFEERQDNTGGVRPAIAGKDRKDFTEFYDEYEAAQGFAGMGKDAAQLGTWVITGPISYIGQPALQRDIANLKAAMKQAGVKHGFPAGGRSRERRARAQGRALSQRGGGAVRDRRRAARGIQDDRRRRPDRAGRRRVSRELLRRHGAAALARRLPEMGGGPRRGA